MRIGICTKYLRSEETYAALSLARFALGRGADVYVAVPDGNCTASVDASWDRRLFRLTMPLLQAWSEFMTTIIWTFLPTLPQIVCAHRKRLRTVVIPAWDDLRATEVPTLSFFDQVVVPSQAAYLALCSHGLGNVCYSHWDVGLPSVTGVPASQSVCRVFLPLWGTLSQRIDAGILQLIRNSLSRCSVCWTIAYIPTQLNASSRRALQQLAHKYPDRVRLIVKFTQSQLLLECSTHNLLLWPSRIENYCWPGLFSMAAGVPLLAFAVPPMTEFVTNNKNGILVDCDVGKTEFGALYTYTDYGALEQSLYDSAANPAHLCALREGTVVEHNKSIASFSELWSCLLR